MIKVRNILVLIFLSVYACTEGDKVSENSSDSNEWELVVLDSIQVDYLAEIREGIFSNGIGLIKDISSNTLIKFDSLGNILVKKEFPKEGPESVMWLETLLAHNGEYFGTSSFSDIYHFDANINLKGRLKIPFMGESRGGAYNRKNICTSRSRGRKTLATRIFINVHAMKSTLYSAPERVVNPSGSLQGNTISPDIDRGNHSTFKEILKV